MDLLIPSKNRWSTSNRPGPPCDSNGNLFLSLDEETRRRSTIRTNIDPSVDINEMFGQRPFHKGSHPEYTETIATEIRDLRLKYSKINKPSDVVKKDYLIKLNAIAEKYKIGIVSGKIQI